MNPLTNVKNITKLNEIELTKGTNKSWHEVYKDSAWIFIGGLAYGLTEGDILAVFSQYGEIVNINLVRDKKTGKIKGFCFLCYANQKSTILAVDNFNGIKLLGRTIRVDHVENYKPPKDNENDDDLTKQLKSEGCAPKPIKSENSSTETEKISKKKKAKKEKKKHKKKRKKSEEEKIKVKQEKSDPGYDKYEYLQNNQEDSSQIRKRKVSGSESSDSESSSDDSTHNASKKIVHVEINSQRYSKESGRNEISMSRKNDLKYKESRQIENSESESNDQHYHKNKTGKDRLYSKNKNRIPSNSNKSSIRHRHFSYSSEDSSPKNNYPSTSKRKKDENHKDYHSKQETSHANSSKKRDHSNSIEKDHRNHHDSSSEDDYSSNSRSLKKHHSRDEQLCVKERYRDRHYQKQSSTSGYESKRKNSYIERTSS